MRPTIAKITLSTDTSAYASGDLLADTQEVARISRKPNGLIRIETVTLLDESDSGVAFDLYFSKASTSFGTENSAPNISDANARDIVGFLSFATGDYKDIGGAKLACLKNIGLIVETNDAGSLYVAAVNGTGTPTFAAGSLSLKIGALQY